MKMNYVMGILLSTFLSIGCGGSNTSDNNITDNNTSDNNITENNTSSLILNATYELPWGYTVGRNAFLDRDRIVCIGGVKAQPIGAQHNGHPAFVNQAMRVDLINGSRETLDIQEALDTNGSVSGIGNNAMVYKLDTDKYFVYGGFQYIKNIYIVDFENSKVDSIGTGSFYADGQGSALDNEKNIYFFGYYDGLYGKNTIMKFSHNENSLMLADVNLTIPRYNTTGHRLEDGRIIVVGGWDGSGDVIPNSATRRVEIFNPDNNSIVRVSDYPEPISSGQRERNAPVSETGICIGNYEYNIALDKWANGCTIKTDSDNFDESKYIFPGNGTINGSYFGTLSNGNIVYVNGPRYSSTYSDALQGYPIEEPTKIYVYVKE